MLSMQMQEMIILVIGVVLIIELVKIFIIWCFIKSAVKSATYEAVIDAYNTIQEHNEKYNMPEEMQIKTNL
jgi:hypothetical protein